MRRATPLLELDLLAFAGLLLFFAASAFAQEPSAETQTAFGLHSVGFQTPKGKIQVNLPDDVAASDTISGTVVADASGKGAAEQARNRDELNGYVVEMEGQKASVNGKVFRWTIPAAIAGTVPLVLRNNHGQEIAHATVPIQPAGSTERPSTPSPWDFQLPGTGQAGRPLQIPGPFDGNSTTTSVVIGGKAAPVLAESPRKTIVQCSSEIIGPTEIALRKDALEARGPFRSIGVQLTAPKTTLRRGERTSLTVQVHGLDGLQQELLVRLENRSTTVVSLEGGDAQSVTIRPQDVQSTGTYALRRTMTGIQPGSFDISAFLAGGLADHLKNVTNPPPHQKDVTRVPHLTNKTWYTNVGGNHQAGHSWPPHEKNVTFPQGNSFYGENDKDGKPLPHKEKMTWPEHQDKATWPPHSKPQSWPPHAADVTWPPFHDANVSWPTHQANISWPPPKPPK